MRRTVVRRRLISPALKFLKAAQVQACQFGQLFLSQTSGVALSAHVRAELLNVSKFSARKRHTSLRPN